MKKGLLIFILFFFCMNCAYSNCISDMEEHFVFLKSLKLSAKQTAKIEEIKIEYGVKETKLNAEIILNNMQSAQLSTNVKNSEKIKNINLYSKFLHNEIEQLPACIEEDILHTLNLFQKWKYKRFLRNKD